MFLHEVSLRDRSLTVGVRGAAFGSVWNFQEEISLDDRALYKDVLQIDGMPSFCQ